MSQYKTHAYFNLFLALPLLLLCLFYFFNPPLRFALTFMGCFIYSTLFMNPDLDLAHQIKPFSLRGLLTLPFRSYSLIFKHRGLSHSLLFGSLTRIAWLTGTGLVIFYLVYRFFPSSDTFLKFFRAHRVDVIFGFAGVFTADLCHLILDNKIKRK